MNTFTFARTLAACSALSAATAAYGALNWPGANTGQWNIGWWGTAILAAEAAAFAFLSHLEARSVRRERRKARARRRLAPPPYRWHVLDYAAAEEVMRT